MTKNLLPVSAFIICLNEEDYLGNCIESLDQCAEIVIVDSGSSDGTIPLIKSYQDRGLPIRLAHNDWPGYAVQKQFALDLCTQPWCLNIDSDERLDAKLKEQLPELTRAGPQIVGWRITRRPYLIGYGYTPERTHERGNLRLIRKGRGDYDLTLKVHEGIRASGTVHTNERGSLLHYRPLPMAEQILKENKYSSLKADMLIEQGSRPRLGKLVLNPFAYFFNFYVRAGLWRCGVPGFIHAATRSAYALMTEAKIFEQYTMKSNPPFDDLDGTRTRSQ